MPNYVGPALSRLSETLYRGLSDIGKSRLATEEMDLKRAKMLYDVERDKPRLELEQLQLGEARRKEEKRTSPFRFDTYVREAVGIGETGDVEGTPNPAVYEQLRWGATLIPKVAKAIGTKVDPQTKTLIKLDTGQPLTNEEWEDKRIQSIVAGVVGGHVDKDKFLELRASQGDQEAIGLLRLRTTNPFQYYTDEFNGKLQNYTQALAMGIPKETLSDMLKQMDRTQTKIDKLEKTPEEKKLFDLSVKKLEAEIEKLGRGPGKPFYDESGNQFQYDKDGRLRLIIKADESRLDKAEFKLLEERYNKISKVLALYDRTKQTVPGEKGAAQKYYMENPDPKTPGLMEINPSEITALQKEKVELAAKLGGKGETKTLLGYKGEPPVKPPEQLPGKGEEVKKPVQIAEYLKRFQYVVDSGMETIGGVSIDKVAESFIKDNPEMEAEVRKILSRRKSVLSKPGAKHPGRSISLLESSKRAVLPSLLKEGTTGPKIPGRTY